MFTSDDCDECIPDYARRRSASAVALSSLPFLITFFLVATAVLQRLFPLLSGRLFSKDHPDGGIFSPLSPNTLRQSLRTEGRKIRISAQGLVGFTFSTNIALSAVLVELILCEISNLLNPAARSLALRITLPSLLFLLIVAAPALELHSIISSAGWKFVGVSKSHQKIAWALEGLGLTTWLLGFWHLGRTVLGSYLHESSYMRDHSLSEGCLERIGVIGIALMASLAGFAAVSSLWQTFGQKPRLVTDAEIARKQAGLDATIEMLQAKQSRLRALQRKMSDAAPEGFVTRVIGTIRGTSDSQERKALKLEISGLETMKLSLSNSLASLQARQQTQQRSTTPTGRMLNLFAYIFSLYCLYRLCATTFTTLRRYSSPSTNFSNSDPINNFLAILAKTWDPTIDRAAWSRQISFLLSGVMFLASFNSVLQTFLLFGRFAPSILQHARMNLPLLVSQVCATYVISSALLLRSNLPSEVRGVISGALGAPLEPAFVEQWFEGWFLITSALTALGIWLGRKVRGSGWDDDDDMGDGDVEMGKFN